MSLHEEKKEALTASRRMRAWVIEAEHLFAGSWARAGEVSSQGEVGRRFDAYLGRLSCFLEAEERTDEEKLHLGQLLKVLTHLRPGRVQGSDRVGFPRTTNEMERLMRASKMQDRRSSGRKNWNSSLLREGRCVAYHEWWLHPPDGEAQLQARLRRVPSSAWRHVRQETRHCHREPLNRFRFRHRPLESLASLEMRWEQTPGTGVLPP